MRRSEQAAGFGGLSSAQGAWPLGYTSCLGLWRAGGSWGSVDSEGGRAVQIGTRMESDELALGPGSLLLCCLPWKGFFSKEAASSISGKRGPTGCQSLPARLETDS